MAASLKSVRYRRQNICILVLVLGLQAGLLWLASHGAWWAVALAALGFSFLGLTNYAVIHEAAHRVLHDDRRVNDAWGAVAAWHFPVAFTFMRICHDVHHRHNRTDHELFDYYYEHDNRLVKFGQWYSILLGIYPPIIPIGSLLMALAPWVFWTRPWQKAKSSSIIFNRGMFTSKVLWRIRLEVAGGIAYWMGMFYLLDLAWLPTLILFAAFWVNWSTRQYVTHAFSRRDVIRGAWNLKVSRPMGWILLNGHWDLVHHTHPTARWQDLPELGRDSEAPIAYWPQYFRQWRGPRPNPEPAPEPLFT